MRHLIWLTLALAAAAPVSVSAQGSPATAPSRVVDPGRLDLAEKVANALVPDGVYARMMQNQFPAMMDAMMEQFMGMRAGDLGAEKGQDKTMAEIAREKDPAFDERMKIMTKVMSSEMGTLMSSMEPRVRTGLSHALERNFTTEQLGDMTAFFATPSGKAFANDYLALFADPEMTKEMMAVMPEMMRAMPKIMEKMKAATAHLPPPPKPDAAPTSEGE